MIEIDVAGNSASLARKRSRRAFPWRPASQAAVSWTQLSPLILPLLRELLTVYYATSCGGATAFSEREPVSRPRRAATT
jgi:hypothetical protein